MKKEHVVQLLIITGGLLFGVYFSKKNFAIHQQTSHGNPTLHSSMDHGLLDISKDSLNPSIEKITFSKDKMSGWNFQIHTAQFKFTPKNVNRPHRPGEGHAHLYINGKKYTRLYGHHFHLPELAGQNNEIKVTLNANGHEQFAIKDQPIEKIVLIP